MRQELVLSLLGLALTSARPSSAWSTGGSSEEDGVEVLCDASFLQTSLHTEQMLSPGTTAPDARKSVLEAPVLSFFQVEEAIGSSGEMTVSKEEALPGGEGLLNPSRLRICSLLLKAALVLVVLWKGATSFTRLVDRRVAPEEVKVPDEESLRQMGVEEPTPEVVPTLTATEVQKLLPAFSGYDCALSKPKSLGRAFRLRARIYGPSEAEALVAPFSEEACVACTTQVHLPGEALLILERSESVDFVATLEGAPDVQLTVHAQELQMCMRGQKVPTSLDSVPQRLRELAEAEMAARGIDQKTTIVVQEDVLKIGDMVTLVGDLHRTAGGQLLLWPSQAPQKRNRVWDILDGMHVLVSDEENFGREEEKHEEKDP